MASEMLSRNQTFSYTLDTEMSNANLFSPLKVPYALVVEALRIISYHAAHTDLCPLSLDILLFVKFAKSSTGLHLGIRTF